MGMCVCGVERTTFSLCLYLLLCLTSGSLVCRYIYQASWPLKFQGLTCLCLLSHSRNNGFTDTNFQAWTSGASGDSDSSPHVCVASILSIASSPQPALYLNIETETQTL